MRIVVIGAVAAGMSAASQAKRRMPGAEVIVLERTRHVSFGACGMPYNIEDPAREMEDLVVMSAQTFREKRGIDLRTEHEALAIDPAAKTVTFRDKQADSEGVLSYDKLIIATGASAFRPPIPGLDTSGVFVLRGLDDGIHLKAHIAEHKPTSVVIIGAGYIGLEMAEVLTARGVQVTMLEKLDQVAPGYHPEIAGQILEELKRHGVTVELGINITEVVEGEEANTLQVQTDRGVFTTDLVLVSVGIRPNAQLAEAAGIELGASGAIATNAQMETSHPDIYAAGDCAEAYHIIMEAPAYIPLGTTANKQGKLAGANAVGAGLEFGGIVGTAGFKVFDLEVARTGLGAREIEAKGLQAPGALSKQASKAHGYPGSEKKLTTVLYARHDDGRLVGAQMVGPGTVAKRIDVFATALHANMTLTQIEALDLSYAPPFAPVYDPILIAATVAKKKQPS